MLGADPAPTPFTLRRDLAWIVASLPLLTALLWKASAVTEPIMFMRLPGSMSILVWPGRNVLFGSRKYDVSTIWPWGALPRLWPASHSEKSSEELLSSHCWNSAFVPAAIVSSFIMYAV